MANSFVDLLLSCGDINVCIQFVRVLLEVLHLCSEGTLACSFTSSLGLDQSSDAFMGWGVFSLLLIFPEVGFSL